MPKRTKPRKPNAIRIAEVRDAQPTLNEIRRKKVVRFASITIVLALVATFLIGAIASTPAKAAPAATPTSVATMQAAPQSGEVATPVPVESDTDGDGIINNADPDIDNDGIVNGVDSDIDGDGVANESDQDPAATNGGSSTGTEVDDGSLKLPNVIPVELNTSAGRLAIAAVILAAGLAIVAVRRKRKK